MRIRERYVESPMIVENMCSTVCLSLDLLIIGWASRMTKTLMLSGQSLCWSLGRILGEYRSGRDISNFLVASNRTMSIVFPGNESLSLVLRDVDEGEDSEGDDGIGFVVCPGAGIE